MHKGDLLPNEAFDRLKADPEAVLLDVRTGPEWTFVGSPAVDRLLRISWQTFPTMEVNPRFAAAVEEAGVPKIGADFLYLPLRLEVGARGLGTDRRGVFVLLQRRRRL